MEEPMQSKTKPYYVDERGFVLVLFLLLLLAVTLVGLRVVTTTSYEINVSRNKRISEQAFGVAEAGVNEFKGRFWRGATGEISDNAPTNPDWR